jgi:hypothetical protein
MKLRWKLGIAIPAALIAAGAICWYTMPGLREWVDISIYFVTVETELKIHPPPSRCKAREAEFSARVDRTKQHAKSALKVGTKKEDVIRFFASEGLPVYFLRDLGKSWAQGEINVKGDAACFSLACGDDAALLGVRVDVDENGAVISIPVVVGMYTNCL